MPPHPRARLALPFVLCAVLAGCGRPPPGAPPTPNDADAQAEVHGASGQPPVVFAEPPDDPPAERPPCRAGVQPTLFTFPRAPRRIAPLRVVALSDVALPGRLALVDAKGREVAATDVVLGSGPPYRLELDVAKPPAGKLKLRFEQPGCDGAAPKDETVWVQAGTPERRELPAPLDVSWVGRRAWTHALENLYSAWIERLFAAPEGASPSWASLADVLHDPARNLFYDYLGAGEDEVPGPIKPDCADLPFFLRAYFAWKLDLPLGVSTCNRGGGGEPPTCKPELVTQATPPLHPKDTAADAFYAFLRGPLADKAHSGSARIPADDEVSDYYPVPLTWESLRPGTVYADPFGHVLVLAARVPATRGRPAELVAVDGQPDGTVARKRYWRGNFLYAKARELGGPGFKRFRPLVKKDGELERATNEEVTKHPAYGDLDLGPSALDAETFYDRLDAVLAPKPLDPRAVLLSTIDALEEQVRARVRSVENGRAWLARATEPVPMPEDADLFETQGPWEDYSTPSRDLRLLIALDVARGVPARVLRHPARYALPAGASAERVAAALDVLLADELRKRSISYTRSDGSSFPLPLAEILARASRLEVAYNPNDCPEIRWGAPAGSPEAAPCAAHAPEDQRQRMEAVRAWFRERRRPARR